jgi:2-keto-3-deoxy-L-rhamnonate aldolase RhmA
MSAPSLRSRILSGEKLLGCFLTWPTDGFAELLANARFDFLVLDSEHGYFNPESVERMVRAADGAGVPAIVRVPNCHASAEAGRALDAGAAGTLFPRANGAAPVRAAIEGVKYAPPGKRGLAGVRANRYGAVPFDHWVLEANENTAVAIQIETAGAVNAVEAIAAEKWVDLLFVGPNDLSQALGVPGHYDDPRYVAALDKVGAVARDAHKRAGIMLRTADQIAGLAGRGYTVFTTSDRSLLLQSAAAWRDALPAGKG